MREKKEFVNGDDLVRNEKRGVGTGRRKRL